jgi:large subunit ribosomal protein L25
MALVADTRTDFGKGAARRLRREGRTPAVVYGHGQDTVHVSFDSRELLQVLRKHMTSVDIVIDGKTQTVAPRDVQIEPVRRYVEHVDLVVVTAAEAASIARAATEASEAAESAALAAAEAAAAKAATRAARIEEAGFDSSISAESTEGAAESAE